VVAANVYFSVNKLDYHKEFRSQIKLKRDVTLIKYLLKMGGGEFQDGS
jgi:hypothetical protein